MKTSLINYLKQRFPENMNIQPGNFGNIIVRDSNAEKGHGYKINILEESLYIEASIEFEDYAKELSDHANRKILEKNNQIISLFKKDTNLYANRHRKSVEGLFDPASSKDDGWGLSIGYRKNGRYPIENFVDLLLSFILFLFPYDVSAEEEGISVNSLHTDYERSFLNRSFCLAFHGYDCKACGISLREKYGDIAREFIHVHHLNPISESGGDIPDPINDMVPLCPNCHSIAHLRTPSFSLEEIKNMINTNNERL